MELIETIPVQKAQHSRLGETDLENLEFGKYMSDHMFTCTYSNGKWQEAAIVPYQDLILPPTTLALHYGQSIFEGMKAFRMQDGSVNIFRVEKHHDRLNRSLDRMCMPDIPRDLFINALQDLVRLDEGWVPYTEGSALYLRPFVFASESKLGVKISEEYRFIIVTGPVPLLYPRPISVKVEKNFIRAAKGGTGYAKCAGNYGASFYATQRAKKEGFDQVIWTDAFRHEFIEESGTMNLMFVLDGKLVTPPVSDTILDGITRDTLLTIAASLDITVEERPIGCNEILRAFEERKITEAFGVGTAAVVAPIDIMGIDNKLYQLPLYNSSSVMFRLKRELEDIRTGKKPDSWKWNFVIS